MVEQQQETATQSLPAPIPNNRGIVYVLTNQAMEGYVKVGKTSGNSARDVLRRMNELDVTGVPRAFDCKYAAVVDNYEQVERALLTGFGENRVRSNREFLEGIAPFRVKAILKLHESKEVTPHSPDESGMPEELEKPPRAKNLRFSMVHIPVGENLEWSDDAGITCRVVSDNRVEYNGEEYPLSRLTSYLKGWKYPYAPVQSYWLYEGETLQERRDRFEV